MSVSESDISTVHRLGRKRDNTADRRSIIVKFTRRDLKRRTLLASKQRKNDQIYVNESLTPMRKTVFNALRKMKRAHPALVKGCTTVDGRVYAYTGSTNGSQRDRRHLVNTQEELVEFCREYVKQPLDLFLNMQG